MCFYFVRHGQSEANVHRVFANGFDDTYPLTDLGRDQIKRTAAKLEAERPTSIITSPVYRARQSAEILADFFDLQLSISPALAEYGMGEFEGLSDDASWAKYWEISNAWMSGRDWDVAVPGGETLNQMRERFEPFIEELRSHDPNERVILMTHGGLLRCMLPGILAKVPFSFATSAELDNGEIVTVDDVDGELLCRSWGDKAPPS